MLDPSERKPNADAMGLPALGWTSALEESLARLDDPRVCPGRVAIRYGRVYRLYTPTGELDAEIAGRVRHRAQSSRDLPAVGDWVAFDPEKAVIRHVLPRRNQFSRKAVGRRTEEQVVAANIDTLFLMMGLDSDFNLRRIERYLISARDSGAQPVIVLNKTDLCDNVEERTRLVRQVASDTPVHAICSLRSEGISTLSGYLPRGVTVALLGSSGVGKSTLINRLLGSDVLRTQEVRLSDHRGRHATTRRELIILPEGGLIVDTPGLRELQLWTPAEGLGESFDDIHALATHCFFSDCQHQTEPRCAVKQAVADGALSSGRLESYQKLQSELAHLASRQDALARAAEKGRVKSIHKAMKDVRPRR